MDILIRIFIIICFYVSFLGNNFETIVTICLVMILFTLIDIYLFLKENYKERL